MTERTQHTSSPEEPRDGAVDRRANTGKPESAAAGSGRIAGTAVVFLIGLVIGWLVLGWWLWPVQWMNALPWHLQSPYRNRYVRLVATSLWHTGDTRHAREALEGWDHEDLGRRLASLQQQASNEDEREQLETLALLLDLPTPELSIWHSLLSQSSIVGWATISLLLLASAGVLTVYSLVPATKGAPIPATAPDLVPSEEEDVWGDDEGFDDYDDDELIIGEIDDTDGDDEEDEDDIYGSETDFYEAGEDVVESLSAFMFDNEEEDVTDLKGICERLPEIDVSELNQEAQEVAEQLGRGIDLRARGLGA